MPTSRTLGAIAVALVAVLGLGGCAALEFAFGTDEQTMSSRPTTEEDDDFGTVNIYDVTDEGTLDPATNGLAANVWETFTRVTTIDFAGEVVVQFRTGDAPDSDTLAYVYQDDDPNYWVLAANLATSEDENQLIATLIHEYAHILTLGLEEVSPATDCSTLELSEGCVHEESMLQAFNEEFWAMYGDAAPAPDNVDGDIAYDFYLEHEDDFVSDYAATNVVEDIAETFMTFVLEPEPDSSESVVAQKLGFFWGYPEMVAIRERIRTEFADDLGLEE